MPTEAPKAPVPCTLLLTRDLVAHLETQARYLGMSRAAYIRGLIVRDREQQAKQRGRASKA